MYVIEKRFGKKYGVPDNIQKKSFLLSLFSFFIRVFLLVCMAIFLEKFLSNFVNKKKNMVFGSFPPVTFSATFISPIKNCKSKWFASNGWLLFNEAGVPTVHTVPLPPNSPYNIDYIDLHWVWEYVYL